MRTRTRRGRAPTALLCGLACTLLLSGCVETSGTPPPVKGHGAPPCRDSPASSAELGSPQRLSGRTARFSTDGSTVYVTARSFEKGGPLDPEQGLTAVWVGHNDVTPRYDEQSGRVLGATERIMVREGDFGAIDLDAGRYWLWTSTGGDVLAISCARRGVSDAEPA